MLLGLLTSFLFISRMQSVNGAYILNIALVSLFFATEPVAAVFVTDIFPLTSIYA